MKVLILGSTGLIGSQLLQYLIEDSRVESVIALVRKEMVSKHMKLKYQKYDFETSQLNLEGVDSILCCLGTTMKVAGSKEAFKKVDHDYPLAFAKLGKEHGAKKFFLVSALGANENSLFFYNKVKGEVEQKIKDLGYETFLSFRPSLLLGKRSESRPLENTSGWLMKKTNFLLFGPFRKFQAIEAKNVAKSMHAKLFKEDVDIAGLEIKDFKEL